MALNTSPGANASAYAVVTTEGVVTGIQIQNAGTGYLAPPKIQILGDGAGAEAICTGVNSIGGITSIEVVSGGSGYWPLQYQSTQQATVLITKGYVLNIKYR
jgi:hypothetical protein